MNNKDNKKEIYEKALSDTIKELAIKRTELSTLAKTTVDNINQDIPRLRDQLSKINEEIKKADNLLKIKKEDLAKDERSYIEHYNKLEEKLNIEISNKQADMDRRISEANSSKLSYESKIKETENERLYFVNANNILNNEKSEFEKERRLFSEHKIKSENDIAISLNNLNSESKSLDKKRQEILKLQKESNDKFNERDTYLLSKEQEVRDILDRLEEVVAREELISKNTEELEKRENNLNSENIKLILNIKANNKRSVELNNFKKDLEDREKRIKSLEEEILKKV